MSSIPLPASILNRMLRDTEKKQIKASPTQKIELLSSQLEWSKKSKEILTRNHGYIDTSPMGAGKTVLTIHNALYYGFKLFIVCPVTLIPGWRKEAEKYGVEIVDIVSYQSLRSVKDRQPKHGYLARHDYELGNKKMTMFGATQKYLNVVNDRTLVVFDEIQNIKNNSAQFKACTALLDPIIRTNDCTSRYALLSATPFDKEKLAVNLLKLIGYIRSQKLYYVDNASRELILEGLGELIESCTFIDKEETEAVLAEIPIKKKNMDTLCFTLYSRVIRRSICGSMPKPDNIVGKFDVKNGFYPIVPENATVLAEEIKELAESIKYNENTGTADMSGADLGRWKKALVKIELAKTYDMCVQAHKILSSNLKAKCIICVNYHGSNNEAQHYLRDFHPLVLTGNVKPQKRPSIVDDFNNNPNRRLLIMNPDVGGVGISLHDTTGEYPRYMFISPSYKLIETAQAASRIHRYGTMSDATVRMFYGNKDGLTETKILSAMADKTAVVKGVIDDVSRNEIILPGDYGGEFHKE